MVLIGASTSCDKRMVTYFIVDILGVILFIHVFASKGLPDYQEKVITAPRASLCDANETAVADQTTLHPIASVPACQMHGRLSPWTSKASPLKPTNDGNSLKHPVPDLHAQSDDPIESLASITRAS